ncbi:PhzF family phenazine biosynthesis protein [Burkholderia sp. Bp8986]|uniref:PhzF family phenazine biosynthesis protein n=1 Tax=Burkholderia sp. Bp8986 TaxID=2184550 RepID=UPI000F5A8B97|nr:PhzF family phenazine biosynthesis protein [Burkholderia sp. Bp8986]RQS48071.1 PhzF family phenazine biosynthesis protein [Burkholderia sp. Bp8986]
MKVQVHIVNSLTDGEAGGNPAGVVIDADALDTKQRLAVARKVGLSETAFVSKSSVATIKLEFFTPTRQIAHCGHATIATFSLLRQLGRVSDGKVTKETVDGYRNILVDDQSVLMEQGAPAYTSIEARSDLAKKIAESIGLRTADIYRTTSPTVVNTGNSFLMIALPDGCSVAEVKPDHQAIALISEELDLIGYYLFSRETVIPGRHAGTRMFAPRFGIPEESATGTAAGPLACFIYERMGARDPEMIIEQGWMMQPASPSIIKIILDIEDGKVARLMAGGSATIKQSALVEI